MMPFACVDYDFYANVFMGSRIGPDDFCRFAARAMLLVDGFCQGKCRSVPEQDWPQMMFAVCSVAEILMDEETMEKTAFDLKSSETVGNYSVSYRAPSGSNVEFLEKKKRDALVLYLSNVPALRGLFHVRSFPCMHHIL